MKTPNEQRERKWFWLVENDKPIFAEGMKCQNNYWYFPSIGLSLSEEYHLYSSKSDAVDSLKRALVLRMEDAAKKLSEL